MRPNPNIRQYAVEQARMLLRRLAYQANRFLQNTDAGAVHDLRVAARRFGQCLRVFGCFFPRKERKVRRRLRELMSLSSEVRNRDIALGLIERAGVTEGSELVRSLAGERAKAERDLVGLIEAWRRRGFSRRWRAQLEL